MLRRFTDEDRVENLLTQGEQALAAFHRLRHPLRRDALALEVALAIEILIAAPVRVQNLASISLSRHLVSSSEGITHLDFPACEVKNAVDLEFGLRCPPEDPRDIPLQSSAFVGQIWERIRFSGTWTASLAQEAALPPHRGRDVASAWRAAERTPSSAPSRISLPPGESGRP